MAFFPKLRWFVSPGSRPLAGHRRRVRGVGPLAACERLEDRVLLSRVGVGRPFEIPPGQAPEIGISPVVDENLIVSQAAPVSAAPPFALGETFKLHSNPGATKVIYLDFDGNTLTGSPWANNVNPGSPIETPAYSFEGDASFSNAELERIQKIWQRVAEDFIPFDVDVTTEDPGTAALRNDGGGDDEWGVRICIGGSWTDWLDQEAGGIAFVDVFDSDEILPAFVFEDNLGNGNETFTAEAISHETGHTLGLFHDGTSTVDYYEGHGSGATGWAPIMGVGYYQSLTQWSQGEYNDANRTQDDLQTITTENGFGYRADDHGDTDATATAAAWTGNTIDAAGIIERNDDVDVFSFTSTGGQIELDILPFVNGPNLDILAELYDSAGALIATSNPVGALNASFNLMVSAGEYFLHIDGAGQGDPLATGYTDYGSLGSYTVTGTTGTRQVFEATELPKDIPNLGMITSTLTINDDLVIDDLNVSLDISHIRANGLDVFLKGPDGTRVELFTDVGGQFDSNFTDTILDDEVLPPITDGSEPFTGSFKPEGSLAGFDGRLAQGTWTLEITDDGSGGIVVGTDGDLNSWSLSILPREVEAGVTITPTDDSTDVTEGGAADSYDVVLDAQPPVDVTITIDPDDQLSVGGAAAGAATTLTFTYDNWNTPQTVTVSAVDNATYEGSRTGTIVQTVSSTDVDYNGLSLADVTVNITDNDPAPAPSITLSLSPGNVSEIDGTSAATGTVTRTGDLSEALIIHLASSDTSEVTVPATVTIAAGQDSATFTLGTVDDSLIDGTQTVTISAYVGGSLEADLAYGTNGVASIDMWLQDTVVQSDGKLIVAGYRRNSAGTSNDAVVARLNADGTLDMSFGTNGIAVIAAIDGTDRVENGIAVALQSDGKILVGGELFTPGQDTQYDRAGFIVRLDTLGQLDTSFGSNGGVVIDPTNVHEQVWDLLVLPEDDSILVAGEYQGSAALYRYDKNGNALTFPNGSAHLFVLSVPSDDPNPAGVGDDATTLVRQPDGKILVGGIVYGDYPDRTWGIVRLTANLQYDTTFGTDGRIIADVPTQNERLEQLLLQSDGKIVAVGGGGSDSFANELRALARFNTNGSLDTTFGDGGYVLTAMDDDALGYAGHILSDGSILVAGYGGGGPFNRGVLTRYTPNGTLIEGGTTLLHDAAGRSIVEMADGSILVAGFGGDVEKFTANAFNADIASLNVLDEDTTPQAVDDSVTTDEDTAVDIDVLANDTDADGDALTLISVSNVSGGIIRVNADDTITFTPDADYNGPAGFTYRIRDADGQFDTASVSISINPLGEPPIAVNDFRTTDEDTAIILDDVLANDTDLDNDTLTVTSVSDPAGGTATINTDGTITYTPDENVNGLDTFTYTVSDGNGGTDTGWVLITVNAINDAPIVAVNNVLTAPEDGSAPITESILQLTDVDNLPEDITFVVTQGGENGRLQLDGRNLFLDEPFTQADIAAGRMTYEHHGSETTSDVIHLSYSDGESAPVEIVFVVSVSPVNDLPWTRRDTATTNKDTPVTIDVLANDTDRDGDALTIIDVTDPFQGGTVEITDNGTTVTFTPDAGFIGRTQFSYTVSDGNGGTDVGYVTPVVYAPAEINGTVWDDLNSDGVQDAGEPGLENRTVYLDLNDNGTRDGSSTIELDPDDFTGQTDLSNILPQATLSALDGLGNVVAPVSAEDIVGQSTGNNLFGHTSNAGAEGIIWRTGYREMRIDFNVSVRSVSIDFQAIASTAQTSGLLKIYDANDNLLGTYTTDALNAGAFETMTLTSSVDIAYAIASGNDFNGYLDNLRFTTTAPEPTATTDANGDYVFTDVLPGEYVVRQELPQGFMQTVANNDNGYLYGIYGTRLYKIDAVTGDFQLVGPQSPQPSIVGMASTNAGELFGIGRDDQQVWSLFEINPETGVATSIGWIGRTVRSGLTYDHGTDTLYGVGRHDDGTMGLVVFNRSTGTATPFGAGVTGIGAMSGVAFDAANNRVIAFDNNDDEFWAFDVETGAATRLANLAPSFAGYGFTETGTELVIHEAHPRYGENLWTVNPDNGTLAPFLTLEDSVSVFEALEYVAGDPFAYHVEVGPGTTVDAINFGNQQDVNDAPLAVNDTATTVEDTPQTIVVLANDTDPENDLLDVIDVSDPAHGSTTINSDGTITYTPDENFHGSDSFTYTIGDGTLQSEPATVSITINPVNDAPTVAVNHGLTVPEGGSATITADNFQVTDVDDSAEEIVLVVKQVPESGTLLLEGVALGVGDSVTQADINAGWVSYEHDGSDTSGGFIGFSYSDGESSSRGVGVFVGVNETPVAGSRPFNLDEDESRFGNLYGSDPDSGELTFALATGPAHGDVQLNANGSFTYTPDANYNGTDSFTFTVSDGSTTSEPATVSITVDPVNDRPVAVDDIATSAEDTAVVIDVLANDTDMDGDPLEIVFVGGANGGTADVTDDGTTITFTPDANFHGTVNLQYAISDGSMGSYLAVVAITVEPVNDAPQAVDDMQSVGEDGVVTVAPFLNDHDFDGDQLTVTAVSDPAHGQVLIVSQAAINYIPDDNFHGTDSFTYTVSDGNGGTDTATVSITVDPVNDAPEFNTASYNFSTAENSPAGTIVGTVAASDVDGPSVTYTIISGNAAGAFAINALTGQITVADASKLDFETTPTFNLTVQASDGTLSDTAAVTISLSDVVAPQVANIEFGYGTDRWVDSEDLAGRTAPWKITQIRMTFTQGVEVDFNDLVVTGTNGVYEISGFTYDPETFTAVWTLVTPIDQDRVTISLDGDNAAEGVNTEGEHLDEGDLFEALDVLLGDVNGDGVITAVDRLIQRSRANTIDIWGDVNGDGIVNAIDALLVRSQAGEELPL